jgi:hypothetical protein
VNARLAEVLPEIWEEIPEIGIEKLWKCMPDSMAAVMDAKGWYRWYLGCNSIRFVFFLHSHHYKYLDTLYL